MDDLLIWQIADSAFPSGAFAHSGGLEACWQVGQVNADNLSDWLQVRLVQASRGVLPFVAGAWRDPEAFPSVDRQFDLFTNNHVVNRASRLQGQAFLTAAVRIFQHPALDALQRGARRAPMHFAPVFGALMSILQCPAEQTAKMFLFLSLRGWLSSAVRLGIIGPLEAQRSQASLTSCLTASTAGWELPIDRARQTTPLLDIFQARHDRLYSRLFQS